MRSPLSSTLLLLLSSNLASATVTYQPNSLFPISSDISARSSEVYNAFMLSNVALFSEDVPLSRRQEPEPDPNRTVVTPANIFVVQCVEAGFREPCLVFGAPPGRCVDYFDFATDPTIPEIYDNRVSALSTNTGGVCQFYKYVGCNDKGDDPGVTLSYEYNLGEASEGYSGDYDDQISSWRC